MNAGSSPWSGSSELTRRALISSPERARVLTETAGAVLRAVRDDAVTFVAVDGVDGAGKTTFADELAQHLRETHVIRASVDSFHRPRIERYARGRHSAEGFYRDSYDYEALESVLLGPLRAGRAFRRAVFDVASDAPVDSPVESAPAGSVLVFDGIFLHRPELRRSWDYSIYLHVPWEANHHLAKHPEWNQPRYRDGQELYLRECRPDRLANIVIDNTDLARPVIVRRARAAASPRAGSSTPAPGSGSRGRGPGTRRTGYRG